MDPPIRQVTETVVACFHCGAGPQQKHAHSTSDILSAVYVDDTHNTRQHKPALLTVNNAVDISNPNPREGLTASRCVTSLPSCALPVTRLLRAAALLALFTSDSAYTVSPVTRFIPPFLCFLQYVPWAPGQP